MPFILCIKSPGIAESGTETKIYKMLGALCEIKAANDDVRGVTAYLSQSQPRGLKLT